MCEIGFQHRILGTNVAPRYLNAKLPADVFISTKYISRLQFTQYYLSSCLWYLDEYGMGGFAGKFSLCKVWMNIPYVSNMAAWCMQYEKGRHIQWPSQDPANWRIVMMRSSLNLPMVGCFSEAGGTMKYSGCCTRLSTADNIYFQLKISQQHLYWNKYV